MEEKNKIFITILFNYSYGNNIPDEFENFNLKHNAFWKL
jgi:hypothetical protein